MVKTKNNTIKTSKSPAKKKNQLNKQSQPINRKKNVQSIDKCKEWVTQQKKEKIKLQPVEIDDLDSDGSNEDELNEIRINPTPLSAATSEKTTKIYFGCEWQKCNIVIETYAELQYHVKLHVTAHRTTVVNNVYECDWDLCDYETNDFKIFMRHVLYHVYLTNLKTLGEQLLLKKEPLPACANDSRRRNLIPDVNSKYVCMWCDCKYCFELTQEYFDHVKSHCLHEIEIHKKGNRNKMVQCKWLDCKKMFNKRLKMTDHMRSHTGERFVACSNCGSTFNSYIKFYDHFKRQSIHNNYKCSQCFQSYATEELLNNHMYTHINCIKCTMCDMTCPSPAALVQHFRYRHIKERPYKCTECDYGAVTKWDLNKHIIHVHNEEPHTYYCEEFGCEFSCLSLNMMRKHENNVHGNGPNIYCCHCCNRRYQNGGSLSRHLIKIHGFQLPSGHRRFTYRQDIDGIYRVQTTRIESLEVSKQIMATPTNDVSNENIVPYTLTDLKKNKTGFSVTVIQSTSNGKFVKPADVITQKSFNHIEEEDELLSSDGVGSAKHKRDLIKTDNKIIESPNSFKDRFKSVDWSRSSYEDASVIAETSNEQVLFHCLKAANKVNVFSADICSESDATENSGFKCIDNFSVMQKYLKKKRPKNKIIITVDDIDEQGNVIHTETQKASEFQL